MLGSNPNPPVNIDNILFLCYNIHMNKKVNKKDPFGIPNCNFTLIDKKDSRWKQYKKHRIKYGFDESEFWDFEHTLTSWLLPRIEWYYKKVVCVFQQEDKEIFEKLIYCIWFLKNQYDTFYIYYDNGFIDQHELILIDCREYIKENIDYIFNMGW